jgi:hypothetical protein
VGAGTAGFAPTAVEYIFRPFAEFTPILLYLSNHLQILNRAAALNCIPPLSSLTLAPRRVLLSCGGQRLAPAAPQQVTAAKALLQLGRESIQFYIQVLLWTHVQPIGGRRGTPTNRNAEN